ncbi:MAG: putative quinol monooxygenase [Ornithinimicrobium sp.]
MSDLHVVATIPARAESIEEVRAALVELAEATRSEEGCVSYEVFESASAPGTFVTVEAWRGQSDLDEHLGSAHVARAFEVAGPLLAAEVAIHPLAPVGTVSDR